MWNEEWSEELAKPLVDTYISHRKQAGMTLCYIESHHAIREANNIFGHGNWSYTVDKLDCVSTSKNSNNNNVVTYLCIVSVVVNGTTRQDTGSGHGINKDLGQGHESASKEAVSDALKRCLRTFGDRFGLALYDKEQKHVVSQEELNMKDAQIKKIKALIKKGDKEMVKQMLKECMGYGWIKKEDQVYNDCVKAFSEKKEKEPKEIGLEIAKELKDGEENED